MRNDQLPEFAFQAATDERVRGQVINRRLNCGDSVRRGVRIPVSEKLKRAFDVIQ